jgi:hypothetical protein
MGSQPTATLWLLAYDSITVGTHISVIQEMLNWPNLQHSVMLGESLLDRARSRVASQFLQTNREIAGDVLLFVDADMSWQSGDLSHIARKALEHNAIVGGIFPKRRFGEGSAIRFNAKGEWKVGTDNLIPADYVSTGFIAIPRTALQAVADTQPWIREGYWPMFLAQVVEASDDKGETGYEYLSEDWAFCDRAKKLGFKCYASAYPRLKHEGTYTYRLVDARARPPVDEDITVKLT